MRIPLTHKRRSAGSSEVAIGGLCILLLLTSPVSAQDKRPARASPRPASTATSAAPSVPTVEGIPLLEIVGQVEEVSPKLKELTDRLTLDQDMTSIEQTLNSQEGVLGQKQRDLNDLLAANPTNAEVKDVEQDWLKQRALYVDLRERLIESAKSAEADLAFLDAETPRWQATLNSLKGPAAVPSTVDQVRNLLSQLAAAVSLVGDRRGVILLLQNRRSQQHQHVSKGLQEIAEVLAHFQRSLLARDGPPLWGETWAAGTTQSSGSPLNQSYRRNLLLSRNYLRDKAWVGLIALASFFVGLWGARVVRRRNSRLPMERLDLGSAAPLFERPLLIGLLSALTASMFCLHAAPMPIKTLFILIYVAPVVKLLTSQSHPLFGGLLRVLMVLGVLGGIWNQVVASPGIKRTGLAVWEAVTIIAVTWISLSAKRKMTVQDSEARLMLATARVVLLLMTSALIANVIGNVSLSHLLASGTILGIYSAVVSYTAYLLLTNSLALLFKSRWVSSLYTVRHWGVTLVAWGSRLLAVLMLCVWGYFALGSFAIRDAVLGSLSNFVTRPINVGAAHISLSDILFFLAVLFVGVVLAGGGRVILREDILSRFNFKHGIPNAISTMTYYLGLLLAFLLALSSAGVELSKFTLLTGAFGVGVGFGLQNIINNFASGVILLFERPIRVGDSLEISGYKGLVERIGARSTSIRTPEGAEVLVPNSNLITQEVMNWTLSEPRRRVELPVRVGPEAYPDLVVKLLTDIASTHPKIMAAPKPNTIFTGFDDGALNFELQFWVPPGVPHPQVKSDIAIKVTAGLREAGIDIFVPRFDVQLDRKETRSEDETSPANLGE